VVKQNIYTTECLKTKSLNQDSYSFVIKARDLIAISYVAVRGIDEEEGAVQRVLNKRRISEIKDYILDGNSFVNSFVINWVSVEHEPKYDNKARKISLPLESSMAQMVDGQHRLVGLEEAMVEDNSVGDQLLLVTMFQNLTNKSAAQIFLNINTEQKPVPKSLIYDLFGDVEDKADHEINRSTDLAKLLNEDPESPLYRMVRFPGSPRGFGSIELSTFVSSLKDHLKPGNGVFYDMGIKTLDKQLAVICNYFTVIRGAYERESMWLNKAQNPFLKAAGLNGAMEFLTNTLMRECASRKSFTLETMNSILNLNSIGLLLWGADLKGLDGKTARKKITDYLNTNLSNRLADFKEYEF